MATGKQARDIFARTTKPAKIGLDVTPRIKGRPRAVEPYQKVTVCLFDRQVLLLDKIALAIREKTGKHVRRAELVRAIVDQAAGKVGAGGKDLDKTVQSMLTSLGGGTR